MAQPVRLKARRAAARRIPPDLPADEVESLPFFGKSWYTRGIGYYFRRFVAILLFIVGLAVACAFEYGWLAVASSIHFTPGRIIGQGVWAVALLASFVNPLRTVRMQQRLRRMEQLVHPDMPPGKRRTVPGGGAGMGALTNAGSPASGAFMAFSVLLFFGWFVVLVFYNFQHEIGQEYDARLRLQNRHLPGHAKVI